MIKAFDELEWIKNFFDNGVELNNEGIDRVRNFSLLWNIFETFACNRRADITTISTAVDTINEKEKITTDLISEHLSYFKERYFNEDDSPKELFEGLKFRLGRSDRAAKQKVTETLTEKIDNPTENLKSLLFILYRFRNNLFHGEKEVIRLNGQIDNFTVANDLLTKVLSIMKRHYLING
jgi:hypothetical protein